MRGLFIFVVLSILASRFAVAADIRMVGTDLLGPDFSRAITAWAERNHLPVSIKLEGSRLGLDALKAHEADLGLLVFSPEETPPTAPFVLKPWAYEVAVIVVSERLPLTQLSYAQLGGIFGSTGQINMNLWGDLGAAGEWSTRPISAHALATAGGGGVSLDLFRALVLGHASFKSNLARYDDEQELLGKLSAEEGSIAILPDTPRGMNSLKILSVSRTSGEPAFPPTPENVQAGDYPLRLPVYLVLSGDATALVAARPILRFLLSDEAVPLATQARLMSSPSAIRAKQTQEFVSPQ